MKAWVFLDPSMLRKHGPEKASWCVGWVDPNGKRRSKSCGKGSLGKKLAKQLADKTHAALVSGTYEANNRQTWEQFKADYSGKVLAGMEPGTRTLTELAIVHFERIAKPNRMASITSATFADYVAKRRIEKGRYATRIGDKLEKLPVSKATVNRELRHLKAVFRKAVKWCYLSKMPDVEFLKETRKLPVYVTSDDFVKIYRACSVAKWPHDVPNVCPADWWRGLLTMAYMTGWRVGELLALKWADVDLDAGTAITRGCENKGRRDELVPLHAIVVDHLRKLKGSFDTNVFTWNRSERRLYPTFWAIQNHAGIKLEGERALYGFHDFRRAFATMNADKLTPDVLQKLMRHQSYTTTQRYINLARQFTQAVAGLYVPDLSESERSEAV